jgi:hypothetical protein
MFLNTEHFLETSHGYRGCIRNLEINNKAYNLNNSHGQGDAIRGLGIGDCNTVDDDCKTLTCQHHGICSVDEGQQLNNQHLIKKESSNNAYCQCLLGFDGQFCESAVEVQVIVILITIKILNY